MQALPGSYEYRRLGRFRIHQQDDHPKDWKYYVIESMDVIDVVIM